MRRTHTPLKIDEELIDFCNSIVQNASPVFLEIEPELTAQVNDCFKNVEMFIELNGGNIQYGWTIWTWPRLFSEAEFHAVYVSDDGAMKDITPSVFNDKRRLFLPDNKAVYDGAQIQNIFQPLCDDSLVYNLDRLNQLYFHITNEGDLKYRSGKINSNEIDIEKINEINHMKSSILRDLSHKYKVLPNDPCPCSSGKKYKKCCKE